ncbi:MAG: hypothetical protein CL398_00275 [Acidiferrobacteraceae bacterium]|nr:hypothetical protein [Acidiferrobacteraceae bacterium]|tara:strand:+ start:375 stop:1610 length:1236 start_codon:yes stop_codon:yes gene_type:complete
MLNNPPTDWFAAEDTAPVAKPSNHDKIVLSEDIVFPAQAITEVLFVAGKRGSGKSWTAGVMMEEIQKLGLQFVCFDALDAHIGLGALPNVEVLKPEMGRTINMAGLVNKLAQPGVRKSLVINLGHLPLAKQQELVADYCTSLLEAGPLFRDNNKPLMTFLEECQDLVPQVGRPASFDPIVRLCKRGRAMGFGATLISQRPAGVNKEALSQASIYLVHNVINHRDLKALDDQLSFGTDRKTIRRILSGITAAAKGECVCFAPEFFRDRGYIVIDKVRADRRAEHAGKSLEVKVGGGHQTPAQERESMQPLDSITSLAEVESFGMDNKPASSTPSLKMAPSPDSTKKEEDFFNPFMPSVEYDPEPSKERGLKLNYHDAEETPAKKGPNFKPVIGIVACGLLAGGLYLVTTPQR